MRRLFFFLKLCLYIYWGYDYLFLKGPHLDNKEGPYRDMDFVENETKMETEVNSLFGSKVEEKGPYTIDKDVDSGVGSVRDFNLVTRAYDYIFVQKDILRPHIKHDNQISVFFCRS